MKASKFMLSFVAAAAAFLGASAGAQQGDPIKIGAIMSISGGLAVVGGPQRDAVLMAEKMINQSGGINGRPVKVIIEDDASSPDTAVSKANSLVFGEKVSALIGPSGINQTIAVGAITSKNGVPQIAFSGVGLPIELERKCVYHIAPNQELNARAILAYAKNINAKKIAVLHDTGYGNAVWNGLKNVGPEYGVDFVAVEKFDVGASDATTQAAKIRSTSPDAVIVIGTNPIPIRNLRQINVRVPIIAGQGTATYEAVKAMGDAANDVVHPEFLVSEDPLPRQREFVALFKKTYNRMPKQFEAQGWDAIMVLTKAMTDAGKQATGPAVCDALKKPYAGVFGEYDFGQTNLNGLTLGSYTFSKLINGEFTRVNFVAK